MVSVVLILWYTKVTDSRCHEDGARRLITPVYSVGLVADEGGSVKLCNAHSQRQYVRWNGTQ